MALMRRTLDSPLRRAADDETPPAPEEPEVETPPAAEDEVPARATTDDDGGRRGPITAAAQASARRSTRSRKQPPEREAAAAAAAANGSEVASDGGAAARAEDEVGDRGGEPSDGPVEAAGEAPEPVAPLLAVAEGLSEPPAAGEPLDLLSVRVPEDLRENLRDVTTFLRRRRGGKSSQKRLPEQEVVTMALWLLGDASDPVAMERLGELHDRFHQRRLAVEMRRAGGEEV